MKQFCGVFLLGFLLLVPASASAATLETSAWIPYWRAERGITNALPNVDTLTEINPFIYSVKQDGSLYVSSPLEGADWQLLRAEAQTKGIRFIPTVMWANADAMDEIFRDDEKRAAHVRAIVSEVFRQNLDGIDIDYEAKYAKTRPYFSLFLRDLSIAMGYNKWVMCTIEARTPLADRYSSAEAIPKDIEYANDFTEINKYCDRVRIMAYDQGRIDLNLNKANADPYTPVADTAWVRKVMELAAQDIAKEKLMIGIPTYGYEYDMFVDSAGKTQYSKLWSFNPGYATDIAQKLGLTAVRNSAGEMMLTFPASQSPEPSIPLPHATRVLVWSDEGAVRAKAQLAHEMGLRGVSIFKIDGGQDAGVWSVLHDFLDQSEKIAQKPPSSTPNTMAGSAAASALSLSRNVQTGSVGADVKSLQVFLNSKGFTVAKSGPGSPGNETERFGALTRAAVIAYQKARGITPAVGYVGPITRARLAAE